ncbi:hypothetical protein FB481_10632 [Pseudomonas sp. AG1028]|uniref:hypothetical protein n=1 Tax=Pseudomonas sp. AG1028 TaxID=2572911 RepID=UPI0011AD276E|nr:hypothetical protein [Pseudomonas sp. AG1028]TWE05659.1 hypothetical protein FB481_10632 [Pseudomonas sp. AG1028]
MERKIVAIEPGVGAGPIILGNNRESIQNAYKYIYSSFFKSSDSKFRSDHCKIAGFIAHYDLAGDTNYIEIFNEENQEVDYAIYGTRTKGITLGKLKKILTLRNIHFEVNEYGIEAESIGLSTFNHDLQSDEDVIESFGIFKSAQRA